MVIEYFTSAAFFETVSVILLGIIFIVVGNAIDKKLIKTKSANGKWYRSVKMIIDFINMVIVLILFILILSINGVNVGKYVASLGVIGIVLSFSLQDLIKDIAMGMSIMFEGYFKVGDCVLYEGRPGKVVSFNIKSTKIFMTDTEGTMSVCNRNITKIEVDSDWIDVNVPIGYDVDLQVSRNLCREAAKRISRLRYVYGCDFLNTQELGESSILYKLRVHCLPEKKIPVRRNAFAVVQDVFYENGASFPYNVLIVQNMEPKEKIRVEGAGGNEVTVIEDGKPVTKHKHRLDYELGRGAAKSKICGYDGSDKSIMDCMKETERYSASENLSKDMSLRLRLISEELLSLTKTLPGLKDGKFSIEREGSDYEVCLETKASINKKTKDKLVAVSSSNTNDAYSGLSGLISQAVDSMMRMSMNNKNGVTEAAMNTMEESIGKADDDYRWSYNVYKEKESLAGDTLPDGFNIDSEEIGRSVLTNLSDDIRISVRANKVSFRVLVKNDDED